MASPVNFAKREPTPPHKAPSDGPFYLLVVGGVFAAAFGIGWAIF